MTLSTLFYVVIDQTIYFDTVLSAGTNLALLPINLSTHTHRTVSLAAIVSEPTWTYSGARTEETWDASYPDCATGSIQSPINLNADSFNSTIPLTLDYKAAPFEVVNNSHSIQVNYPAGSTVTINNRIYDLVQFHFHTPSEHTVNGKNAAMEVHFVHQNQAGEIAVIGTMIETGSENQTINQIWRNLPAAGDSYRSDLSIHPENLLSKSTEYAVYSGSLTTPPCTEGVTWILMAEPITLSPEQINDFQALYPMNARAIQRDLAPEAPSNQVNATSH